jgi:hypothetical protein
MLLNLNTGNYAFGDIFKLTIENVLKAAGYWEKEVLC